MLDSHKKYKIIVITVTYNRTITLKKTIDSLLSQSYPIYKIIIVDNNSISEEKKKLTDLTTENSQIEILWLNQNLGGAGGFNAGMLQAKEKYDPDWYWIMDDDAYPRQNCLEKLLKVQESLECIGGLCPLIYGIDNKEYQMYHHKIVTPYFMKEKRIAETYDSLNDISKIDANAFVGPLFSKEAIDTVGIADRELFIYGDDTEYTYRLTRKLNLYLVKSAVIDHQDPPSIKNITVPNAWWKEYYMIRNKFLFVNKYQKNIFKRFFSINYLSFILVKKVCSTLIKRGYKNFRVFRIKLLIKAWLNGFFNKKGKTLDPKEYNELIKLKISK